MLGPFAVLMSEMPRAAAWPLASAALIYGMWLIRREHRRPQQIFVFAGDREPVVLDGDAIADVVVDWRGPLAFIRWRHEAGRVCRLAWWPDTLSPAQRRELRLAAPPPLAARGAPSMAP